MDVVNLRSIDRFKHLPDGAPMEGWDEEHEDMVIIKQKDDGKHYLDGYVAFGDFEEQGPFDSYEEVFQLAVDEMNAFKEDWG